MTTLRRFVEPAPPPAPALARFLAPRPRTGPACELCAAALDDEHRHLVDLRRQRLVCGCRACALRFDLPADARPGAGRYRAVPERCSRITPFALSPLQWNALQVPVGTAFFLRSSVAGRTVAFYPSPAGATESELALDAWDDIVAGNPALARLAADTEAALVRVRGGAADCYVVPVDRCYRLVGELRLHWHGFDGGAEVRGRIDAFFADLDARCRPVLGQAR